MALDFSKIDAAVAGAEAGADSVVAFIVAQADELKKALAAVTAEPKVQEVVDAHAARLVASSDKIAAAIVADPVPVPDPVPA